MNDLQLYQLEELIKRVDSLEETCKGLFVVLLLLSCAIGGLIGYLIFSRILGGVNNENTSK